VGWKNAFHEQTELAKLLFRLSEFSVFWKVYEMIMVLGLNNKEFPEFNLLISSLSSLLLALSPNTYSETFLMIRIYIMTTLQDLDSCHVNISILTGRPIYLLIFRAISALFFIAFIMLGNKIPPSA
jgi:hypothetical protein